MSIEITPSDKRPTPMTHWNIHYIESMYAKWKENPAAVAGRLCSPVYRPPSRACPSATLAGHLAPAILNPPQSGILGMHAIKKRPVVVETEIVIRPMMYLALSYDHRLVDGQEAVTFLRRIIECIENPERVLLEV